MWGGGANAEPPEGLIWLLVLGGTHRLTYCEDAAFTCGGTSRIVFKFSSVISLEPTAHRIPVSARGLVSTAFISKEALRFRDKKLAGERERFEFF